MTCSCPVDIILGRVIESKFWHVEALQNDVLAVMSVEVLTKRKDTAELSYFGNDIRSSCTGRLFSFYLQKKNPTLTESIIRRWRFAVTYDDNLNVFVPVVDVYREPVQCCTCRQNSTRRGFCQHELSCRPRSSNDFVMPTSCGFHADHGFTESGVRTSQVVDGEYEKQPHDRAKEQDAVVDGDKWFANKRNRTALPSFAEHRIIQALAGVIQTAGRCSEKRVPVFEGPHIRLCCKCENAKGLECEKAERVVILFTVV